MDSKRIYVPSKMLKASGVSRESLKNLSFVNDQSNFIYARRVNLAIKACAPADVVIMGDDVELMTPSGFDLLAEEAPLRLLAAAVRGRIGPWWQKEGQNHAEVPFVSFTCLYIPRMVLDAVGPLEEGFPGYGYEDTDYCLRARRAGFSCGVAGGVLIEHSVKIKSAFVSAFPQNLSDMEAAARAAFAEKWRRRLI
jgi:GT2 family glycosyltransferase